MPPFGAYGIAKAAVVQLTRALSVGMDILMLIIPHIKCIIVCLKEHDNGIVLYNTKDRCRSGSRFVFKFSFLFKFVTSACKCVGNAFMKSCDQGLHFLFLHITAFSNFMETLSLKALNFTI